MAILDSWRQLTPYLIFNCFVFLQGALLFGIDTGSFGSLQTLPSFLNRFGVDDGTGTFILPPTRKALMNSLPWIGKISGCLGAEPLIEYAGYKRAMYVAALVQIVAIIIEMTGHHWAQFTVGRIIAYSAVGLVENAVPAYNAETSPAAARGLMSGSIMLLTSLGNLWGAGMSRAYASTTEQVGWLVPTAMQLIPAVGILAFVPFTPESPRWLLLKGRRDEALKTLNKIRPKQDVANGVTVAEVDAIQQLIQESLETEEGSWLDFLKGNYPRRIWIVCTLFVLGQTNGNQFVQSYGATFYVQRGLGVMSFTYAMIGQVVGVVGCIIGIPLMDIAGRRPCVIYGSLTLVFFLYLASGLGSIPDPNQDQTNTLLACFMILPAFTRIAASNIGFVTGAEIGGVRMRKKIMSLGTACDVTAAFLVTFVTPYLLPSMGVKIGWIFGSVALFSVIWAYLFFPELKGRSLEEVDELFDAKLWAWQFQKHKTHGTGHLLALLENGGTMSEKAEAEEAQHEDPKRDVE